MVTVWSTNGKSFLDNRLVTLTFGGNAMKDTHYAVTPSDADGEEMGHQVWLLRHDSGGSSVKLTVTATANDIHDGPRTIEVDAFLDGESLGATQITINDDDRETVAPVFDEGTEIERSVAEDTPAGVGIGAPFMATDDDDDPLTYSLEGADAAFFDIGRTSGQLLTKVALDYETKAEHTLTVTVNDGYGGASSIDVKVLVTDVDEPPEAPSAPQVSPSRSDTTSLDVTWDEPNNKGPEIDDYDLRYRVEGTVGWTDGPQDVAIRSAMIANLIQDTVYEVQVRAWNEEGGGDWSPSGRGAPGDTMPSGATLSDLKVEEYKADPEERPNVSALTPPFNPDVLSYRVLAGGGVPFLEVTAPTNAATATVAWSGPAAVKPSTSRRRVVQLDYGMNVIGVTVTAESGATRTYTVKVRRANGPIELAVGMGFVNSVFYLISGGVSVEESGRSVAQRFTTGRHPTGYALAQIIVKAYGSGSSVVRNFHARVDASIWSVDGDGNPGEELFDLRSTIVGDDEAVPLLLGPPAPQFLQSETEYFLVLKSKKEDFRVSKAPNRAEVSHHDGWDIANHFHTSSDGGSSWTARSDGESIALNIWGIRQPGSTAAQEAASPLTAEFGNVPASHDGETPFTVEIRFNETPHGTGGDLPGMTDETLQAIIGVTNGAVTSVARVNRNGAHRIVTIEPEGNGAVTVSLAPSANCDEVESLCTEDGGSLETLLTIAVPGPDVTEVTPLTASFEDVPAEHDGSSSFRLKLVFSEPLFDGSEAFDNNRAVRDALAVSGGTVMGTRRVDPGAFDAWRVRVRPSGDGAVTVSLAPAPDCAAAGALCTPDGRALSNAVAERVAGPADGDTRSVAPPLTASFADVPVEHDGNTPIELKLLFSEAVFDGSEPFDKNKAVRDALAVSGGTIAGTRRVDPGAFDAWRVRVRPSGHDAVTISLSPSPDCAAAGALCTPDGRALSNLVAARVQGPAGLAVADARVEEGEGAVLAFEVTLDRARQQETTVDYATGDGSAEAGLDYEAASGTLRFAPGETAKTVSVTVLDDAHDEGEETMTLALSNPSGAYLADGEATGTIENTDPMPQAWLVRFGRTASVHVLDAVEERLQGEAPSESWARLGGYRIGGGPDVSEAVSRPSTPDRQLWDEVTETDSGGRDMSLNQLLLGSAFHLVSNPEDTGSRLRLSAWGRVATSGFDGREDRVSFDGTVTTATLGVDGIFERWLTGLAVAYSRGEGAYFMADTDAAELESTLTSLHPYAAWRASDRVTLWGLVGYGSGSLELVRQEAMSTDLTLTMGAVGVRGEVLSQPRGLTLAIRSDALWSQTSSEATAGLVATEADASRLRLVLEGSRPVEFKDGGSFTPVLEVGLRHDGGDAEEGSGVEVGGRLGYRSAFGLSVEVSLRALVAHEAEDYEEWGASGSLRYDPGRQGLGLTASVSPSWGLSPGGVGELWSRPDTRGLAGGSALAHPLGRVQGELGYGLAILNSRGILTPYARVALSEGADQAWHLGTRLALREFLDMSLEATRRQREGERAAHDLALLVNLPW